MTNQTANEVYEKELSQWLPPKIIDCHVHVKLQEHAGPVSPKRKEAMWALEVGSSQSWEQLRSNTQTLFPRQDVTCLTFGGVYREVNTDLSNDYVLSGAKDPRNKAMALYVTRPEWSTAKLELAMDQGFLGIKPYSDLALKDSIEVSIYDFLPKDHLKLMNDRGGIVMLHLPRAKRIGDPENTKELLEIAEAYPSIRLIVAHIGRAYCLPTAEKGLPYFADVPGVLFDTAANLNADVFEYALKIVGPDRILYGSDLPIMLMRGVREHVGDKYINYTDGPYSWNTNRKSPEDEAKYTYYLYEEMKALIEAVRRCGGGKDTLNKILYTNSAKLLGLE